MMLFRWEAPEDEELDLDQFRRPKAAFGKSIGSEEDFWKPTAVTDYSQARPLSWGQFEKS